MKYKGDDGIMQDLFSDNTPSVESERILYTPSTFARSSLLHLQEVGSLKAICLLAVSTQLLQIQNYR